MVFNNYLDKHSYRPSFFESTPKNDLGLVVVIPAYNEKSVLKSINSLYRCAATKSGVEVILVFNASEDSPSSVINTNYIAKKEIESWYSNLNHPLFNLLIIEENILPKKHAGVGLARKIGMDEAVRRFQTVNNPNGVIVCFDADSSCEENYLVEIEEHFAQNTNTSACSIYFEHPTEGNEFDQAIYRGINNYELHLRYYKNGLSYANLPFAYHTIGSSMAVRVLDYCKQGGMNKRKAGEDFYFLQKFIDLGSFSEINTTKVIPSPRQSDRVPFGTGRAIKEMLNNERDITNSYSFKTFELLKNCFEKVEDWYYETPVFDDKLIAFIGQYVLDKKLLEIRSQSTSAKRFKKRFFLWFNAFQTLKFVHFIRDSYYPLEKLSVAVPDLLKKCGYDSVNTNETLDLLREIDRGGKVIFLNN